MDPITILSAFVPLLVQGGRAAVSRWLAPKEFRPSTIEEWERMKKLDLDMFQAINAAGGTNPSYPWVEAIVRLQRPFVVACVFLVWAAMHLGVHLSWLTNPSPVIWAAVDNAMSIVGFYLFGDRTLFYAQQAAQAVSASPTAAVAAQLNTTAPTFGRK